MGISTTLIPPISEFPASVWIAEKHRPAHLQRECQAANSSSFPSSTASRNNFSRHESGPVQQIQKCNANSKHDAVFSFHLLYSRRSAAGSARTKVMCKRVCLIWHVQGASCCKGLRLQRKVLSFFRCLFPSLFFCFSLSLLSVSPSRFLYFSSAVFSLFLSFFCCCCCCSRSDISDQKH